VIDAVERWLRSRQGAPASGPRIIMLLLVVILALSMDAPLKRAIAESSCPRGRGNPTAVLGQRFTVGDGVLRDGEPSPSAVSPPW
jgi:hypothetical protein